MSSLGLAAICPQSPLLSATHGASIEALKGQTHHALCANDPKGARLLASLPESDRTEVLGWTKPSPVSFKDRGETVVLDYDKAEHEIEVALDRHGMACKLDDPEVATVGHIDMAWVHEFRDKTRVAYIGDIKKTEWTTPDGPETLQCAAYGFAYASLMGCDGFVCGLYLASEGVWDWSGRYHDLNTTDSMRLLDVVLHAAANEGDAVFGTHCRNCWAKLHCPEFLLPAALGESELRALTVNRPGTIQNNEALEALKFVMRCEPLLKQAKDTLKTFSERSGGIYDPETRKVWAATYCRGKESVDADLLREKLGPEAEKFFKRGNPYPRMSWKNVK